MKGAATTSDHKDSVENTNHHSTRYSKITGSGNYDFHSTNNSSEMTSIKIQDNQRSEILKTKSNAITRESTAPLPLQFPKLQHPNPKVQSQSDGNSLRDMMILLVHFPLNSFELNPWEVAQIFLHTYNKGNRTSYGSNDSNVSGREHALSDVFKVFCNQYSISPKDLGAYFGSKYEQSAVSISNNPATSPNASKVKMNEDTIIGLKDPILDIIFGDKILRLLLANANLLKWEYSRIFSCYSNHKRSKYFDAFRESTKVPFLTAFSIMQFHHRFCNAMHNISAPTISDVSSMLPTDAIVEWALNNVEGLTLIDIKQVIFEISRLAGQPKQKPSQLEEFENIHMTFAVFVIFSIRCFILQFKKNQISNNHNVQSVHSGSSPVTKDIVVDIVRNMLIKFSFPLTSIQKELRIRVLQPIFSVQLSRFGSKLIQSDHSKTQARELKQHESGSGNPSSNFNTRSQFLLDNSDRDNLIQKIKHFFEIKNKGSLASSSKPKYLPPRPPNNIWDAPRFLQFCQFSGLLNDSPMETLTGCWYAFGAYIRKSQLPNASNWSTEVVPPLPIRVDNAVILSLLEFLVVMSETSISGTEATLAPTLINQNVHFILCKVWLPLLCALCTSAGSLPGTNDSADPSTVNDSSSAPVILEDIIRYGGDTLMQSLDIAHPWIASSYQMLVAHSIQSQTNSSSESSPSTRYFYLEPLVNIVCKFLSCDGLLKLGTVAIQAKRSLQSRIRPRRGSLRTMAAHSSNSSGNSTDAAGIDIDIVSLSISEYEELILRCAFVLWEISGAATSFNPRVADLLGRQYGDQNSLHRPSYKPELTAISEIYIQSCGAVSKAYLRSNEDPSKLSGKNSTSSSWGTDFISPYIMTLQSLQALKFPSSGVIERNFLENREQNYKNQFQVMSTTSSGQSESLNTKSKIANNNPFTVNLGQPHLETSFKPMQTNSLANYTENENVVARSGQLLSGILTERYNHSIADPVLRKTAQHRLALSDDIYDDKESTLYVQNENENENEILPSDEFRREQISYGNNSNSAPSTDILEILMRSGSPRKNSSSTNAVFNNSPKSLSRNSSNSSAQYSFPNQMTSITGNNLAFEGDDGEHDLQDLREVERHISSWEESKPHIKNLLEGTKEVLWPVYATYCSCGDSIEPGKLSGPNLFTLLSKLGLLTNLTVFSDLGILLHQISAHTHAHSPLALAMLSPQMEIYDSPSLSFEEFLIYLCAFSQLRFEGSVSAPMCIENKLLEAEEIEIPITNASSGRYGKGATRKPIVAGGSKGQDRWLQQWDEYMCSSASFKRLLEECILPKLKIYPVLALPDDARVRDKYSPIFSLEVLLAIEAKERPLLKAFELEQRSAADLADKIGSIRLHAQPIVSALTKINLIPSVISETEVLRVVGDVIPDSLNTPGLSNHSNRSASQSAGGVGMVFPQFEWVLSLVAYHAVETAVRESPVPTDPEKIPLLVAELISSISSAMKST